MKKFYTSAVLIFFFSLKIIAQTDSIKSVLSEIVTTANRIATPYYAVGSSISVINSNMIEQRQLKTVVDVLREVPGVSVIQQGGPGKLTYVAMRGANTNHTLVFLDGVKLNDASSPSNAFDFSSLNTNDIDRIEVVRGPQTTLYGSDAIAGVINIITKRGNKEPKINFTGEAGSNNYYRSNFSLTGKLGLLDYAVLATQNGSDGISASSNKYGNTEKDGFVNTSVTSKINLELTGNLNLGLLYKFTKVKADLDQAEKMGDDPNFNMRQEEQILKTSLHSSLFDGRLESQLSASFIRRFSNTIDLIDSFRPAASSDAHNDANRLMLGWQSTLKIIPYNSLIFGIEKETESAATRYLSTSEWGPYESNFPNQSISTVGLYLQDQVNINEEFFANLGVRYDKNDKFGAKTTFRIVPAYYNRSTNTKIKFSYGNGFKAPSLFYLFDPMFGNPDLKPETSAGYDFGIEQFFATGETIIGITYFDLKIENMFGFDSNFKTINIAKANSRGVEFNFSLNPIKEVRINGNYTFNETMDETENSSTFKEKLLRRPKHTLSFNTNYHIHAGLNLNLQLNFVGKRDDNDYSSWQAKRVELPDYTLVTIGSTYKVMDSLTLNARIENLFDKKYEEVLFYGTLGRSFYIGMSLELF